MRAAAILLMAASAPAAAAAANVAPDPGEFARGAAAVGERPSDALALRQMSAPSPSFRLGAAYRAWRNATAAIAHDAANPTGDGGDAEVLAEDCSDERIAFISVETERMALALAPEQVPALAAGIDDGALAAWQARRTGPAAHCPR